MMVTPPYLGILLCGLSLFIPQDADVILAALAAQAPSLAASSSFPRLHRFPPRGLEFSPFFIFVEAEPASLSAPFLAVLFLDRMRKLPPCRGWFRALELPPFLPPWPFPPSFYLLGVVLGMPLQPDNLQARPPRGKSELPLPWLTTISPNRGR